MTDREKLIELLLTFDVPKTPTDGFCKHLADYLLANGVTLQRWIPVEEKPEDGADRYLVLFEDGHMCDAQYEPCIDDGCGFGEYRSYYHPDTLGYLDSEFCSYEGVTHWMPLPESPKEDKP